MRFSEAFSIHRTDKDDWFDPHLTVDTKLFIDPILLLEGDSYWPQAHDELLEHFGECYRLVAKSTSPGSVSGKAAHKMLTFPEPWEFCLGYTSGGTAGSGSGRTIATHLADGIAVAIAAGLTNPEHIEEIGILNERIGADRISDAVCNVLKHRFITYTQSVAKRHGIALSEHKVRNARVMVKDARWVTEKVLLPTNPCTQDPVILVPERLLNNLPVLNADDWFDADLNADLRLQLNLAVGKHATKADIVAFARQNPDRIRKWAKEQTNHSVSGYDFDEDPKGVVGWDKAPAEYARNHPLTGFTQPSNQQELSELVKKVLEQFRHFIEEQRGWSLLHNSDMSEKPEEAAQLVFLGMAQQYLRVFNVELDREVELGRGPVDFKAASGASIRLLIELKKAHNGKFWNGLTAQLPSYLTSDAASEGWYIALRYRDNKSSEARMKELPRMVANVAATTGKTIHYLAIDARRKESASNIKPADGE